MPPDSSYGPPRRRSVPISSFDFRSAGSGHPTSGTGASASDQRKKYTCYPNFQNVREHLGTLRENLVRLHAAGVPVALGTDMWAFPGLGVSIEMDLYVKAGLSPLEAIRAATETAARSLGLEKDRGTLEPGKRADFLLLSGDPLRDVKNVRQLQEVWKSGQPVSPSGPGTRGRPVP